MGNRAEVKGHGGQEGRLNMYPIEVLKERLINGGEALWTYLRR